VFENRILKRLFGPARDEVAGGRRKLHNERFFIVYKSAVHHILLEEWDGLCM
jgi:hypothetical protein